MSMVAGADTNCEVRRAPIPLVMFYVGERRPRQHHHLGDVDDVRPTRGHPNLMDALRLTEKAATDEISAIRK